MRKGRRKTDTVSSRKSLSDRLASMPGLGLGRLGSAPAGNSVSTYLFWTCVVLIAFAQVSPPASRRSSLLFPVAQPVPSHRFDSPVSSRAPSPSLRIAPPNTRFLECSEDELRLGEVRELLREYRRVVEGMRMMGGFADD